MNAACTKALRCAYTEQFLLARRLRGGESPGVPPEPGPGCGQGAQAAWEAAARLSLVKLSAQVIEQLGKQRRVLMRADVPDQTINDAELAVIALVDESAQMSVAQNIGNLWRESSLQSRTYGHTHLGRDFFVRLEVLRARPDTPVALLEIYLRCLCWGFEGKYREEQRPDDLHTLRDSLRADVLHRLGRPPPLAEPLAAVQPPPAPAPLLPSMAVFGMAAALVLLFGVVLTVALSWRASQTMSTLRALGPERQIAGPESGSSP